MSKGTDIETRSFKATELRIAEPTTDSKKLVGYAALFNSMSEEMRGFRERIAPGAFTETIASDDIRALIDHDKSRVLGRNRAGTLRLSQDETGLRFEIDPPNTSYARDIMTSIQRGDVSQMSFSFRTISDNWSMIDGQEVRTLEKVKVLDVSVVTYPAYTDTSVAVRSLELHKSSQSDQNEEETKDKTQTPVAVLADRLTLAEQE